MASKHVKRCSTSYIVRELQLKQYTLVRTTKIKAQRTPNAGKDEEQQELSLTAGGNVKGCPEVSAWLYRTAQQSLLQRQCLH